MDCCSVQVKIRSNSIKFQIEFTSKFSRCSVQKIGKKWHDRRKIITPAFHFKILESFVFVFDRLGNTVIDKLNGLDDESIANGFEFNRLHSMRSM